MFLTTWKRCFIQFGGLCALVVLGSWLLVTTEVYAQNKPTAFQAQQFRPWADPEGMFQTQSGKTLGQWKYKVGLYVNYAKDTLILRDEKGNRITDPAVLARIGRTDPIGHQLGMDLVAGIGFLDWLNLDVVIPVTLYQAGGFPKMPEFKENSGLDTSGFFFSDLKVGVKAQALRQKKHFVDLGFQVYLSIPTGASDRFNGEDTVSFGVRAMVGHQISFVHLALNLGYRFLPATRFLELNISHQIIYSLAARFEILKKRLDLIADIGGATEFTGTVTAEGAPFEFLLGARVYPWKYTDLAVNAGLGFSVSPGYGSPQFRFFAGVTWSPKVHDADKDSVEDHQDRCMRIAGPKENKGCPWPDTDQDSLKDNVDKCPKEAGPKENKGCPWPDTDKDKLTNNIDACPKKKGPAANKGCPWPDTDKDGLHDKIDLCPKQKGPKAFKGCPDTDKDGLHDKIDLCPQQKGSKVFKGCPDTDKDGLHDKADQCPKKWGPKENKGCPVAVIVKRNRQTIIEIRDKIYFRTGKNVILPKSYYIIDNVMRILRRYPKLRIRVDGHTDNVGGYRYNRRLSRRRARAVRNYMRKKGISRRRLRYRGYGYRKPIATNRTKAGRAKNRRVEFVILNSRILRSKR